MTCDGLWPEDLANEFAISGKTLRAWLRREFHRGLEDHGSPWILTHDQVSASRRRFDPGGEQASQANATKRGDRDTPPPNQPRDGRRLAGMVLTRSGSRPPSSMSDRELLVEVDLASVVEDR